MSWAVIFTFLLPGVCGYQSAAKGSRSVAVSPAAMMRRDPTAFWKHRPIISGALLENAKEKAKAVHEKTKATEDASRSQVLWETQSPNNVGFYTVADANFIHQDSMQVKSMQAYAARHNYGIKIMAIHPDCVKESRSEVFFFQKHCTVAKELEQQKPGYTALIFDIDVVPARIGEPGTPSLEKWLASGDDIVFYERGMFPEIAAGNYIARNTPFARSFLQTWADYQSKFPPGFSSADNGAIHVVVPEVLNLPCTRRIQELYSKLVDDMTPQGGPPESYTSFIAASAVARGPPRRWTKVRHAGSQGNLTILPRFHAWAMDGVVVNFKTAPGIGAVFHHGIKDGHAVSKYWDAQGLAKNQLIQNPRATVSKHLYLAYLVGFETANSRNAWRYDGTRSIPFDTAVVHCCMATLTCRPLESGEKLLISSRVIQDPRTPGEACPLTAGESLLQNQEMEQIPTPLCGHKPGSLAANEGTWTRQVKSWSDTACTNVGGYAGDLALCKQTCLDTSGCTAFNMQSDNKGCVLRACGHGTPPDAAMSNYAGYLWTETATTQKANEGVNESLDSIIQSGAASEDKRLMRSESSTRSALEISMRSAVEAAEHNAQVVEQETKEGEAALDIKQAALDKQKADLEQKERAADDILKLVKEAAAKAKEPQDP